MPPLDPGERRDEPRRICHRHCLIRFDRMHFDGQPGSVGAEGYVSDISACGVGVTLRPAIPSGAALAIKPLGPSKVTLPPALVVCCIPVGECWRHGCYFERRLSDAELSGWLA